MVRFAQKKMLDTLAVLCISREQRLMPSSSLLQIEFRGGRNSNVEVGWAGPKVAAARDQGLNLAVWPK